MGEVVSVTRLSPSAVLISYTEAKDAETVSITMCISELNKSVLTHLENATHTNVHYISFTLM